jgi:hypothetical protein
MPIVVPQLDPTALSGLPGDTVRTIEPHTEADNAALLATLLTCFGNAVGHSPHALAGRSRHALNLFTGIVGMSSLGRKGTSWLEIKQLFSQVDPDWLHHCTAAGVSTAEGLGYQVRDGSGQPGAQGADTGVADKRLLLVEEDFAAPLKTMVRQPGILSTVLSQAWDTGDLCAITRTSPIRATGAHISLLAHISTRELEPCFRLHRYSNGWHSRFLWVFSNRSKALPEGGILACGDIVPRLRQALEWARSYTEPIERDDQARDLWSDIYARRGRGETRLASQSAARAEVQILRLSSIYALMDCSPLVRLPHLEAALAFWRYAEDTNDFIAGPRKPAPPANRLLGALRQAGPHGQAKSELHGVFNNHLTAAQLTSYLKELEDLGLITKSESNENGRTHGIYVAAPNPT